MGTPGSASGLGKRARSNPGTAPQADSTSPPIWRQPRPGGLAACSAPNSQSVALTSRCQTPLDLPGVPRIPGPGICGPAPMPATRHRWWRSRAAVRLGTETVRADVRLTQDVLGRRGSTPCPQPSPHGDSMLTLIPCPGCGAPAEVTDRFLLPGTGGSWTTWRCAAQSATTTGCRSICCQPRAKSSSDRNSSDHACPAPASSPRHISPIAIKAARTGSVATAPQEYEKGNRPWISVPNRTRPRLGPG